METTLVKRPIVVGVDTEPESLVALRWAAQEAAASHAPLVLVHALEWLSATRLGRDDDFYFPRRDDALEKGAREEYERKIAELLEKAAAVVGETHPGVEVATKSVEGVPFEVLNAEGREASLLVLGSHARGLLGRMLLGSVSTAIASHPPCPVAVVRTRSAEASPEGMPVVVGFDGTSAARDALTYAADHAAARGVSLIVVHAFRPVDQRTAGSIPEQAERRTQWLHESVRTVEKDHPELTVTCTVTDRRPAQALVDASATARLVVVGSGGRRAFTGSVSQALLHHSWSPVVVIPQS